MSKVRIARVYDDDTGPVPFGPDRVRIDDPAELGRLLAFLEAGELILHTSALEPDVLDPARGDVVGMGFRTDGSWVWSVAVGYYLGAHGIAPERPLLAHIRSCRYHCVTPSPQAADAALDRLYRLMSTEDS